MKRVTWAPSAAESYDEGMQSTYNEMKRAERLAANKREELIARASVYLKKKYPFVAAIMPIKENFEFEDYGFYVKSMALNGTIEILLDPPESE